MIASQARPNRFDSGKRGCTSNRTLQIESLEARWLLSGSSVPHPADLAAAALISSTASATPVLTKISVSPAKASMECSTTEQSTAVGLDQFGHRLTNQPAFTWKASSGTIDQNGLFTSSTQTGSVTITAVSGSKRGTATVTVVNPVLTKIAVSPAKPSVDCYATQQFTAVGLDQFGNQLAKQPAFTWKASSGKIDKQTGLFTPLARPGVVTITAASGSIRGTDKLAVVNCPPTVATPASAIVNPVTGKTATLSVLGSDDGGQANLSYIWYADASPSGAPAPIFSPNGHNAAQQSTVTFGEAGNYTLRVTITDAFGSSTTSIVPVVVQQMAAAMSVTPSSASVESLATQQFDVTGTDQFGDALTTPPANLVWSATAGSITPITASDGQPTLSGLFTAPGPSGSVTVTAACGSASSTAYVTVVNKAPIVATPASATPDPVTGTTAALSVLGADDAGEANLSYTWSTTDRPRGAPLPTFSPNGTNAAKNLTATFGALGTYYFTVTITDAGGQSVASGVSVTVSPALASILVSAAEPTILCFSKEQIAAGGLDQFGNPVAAPLGFTWTASAGSIDQNGLFTAPDRPCTVTIAAASGSIQGTTTVTVYGIPKLSSITVAPTPATVESCGAQQFTADAKDQWGGDMSPQPVFTWTASAGKVDRTGLFTAPGASGIYTVTASSGTIQGTASATVMNQAPTVAAPASATPNPATGTTAALSALGADDGGQSNLSYTWSTNYSPNGVPGPTFSPNGTNAAKQCTVTFWAAGSYSFTATITDSGGLSVTSPVSITVSPTYTSVSVSPATVILGHNSAQQFSAVADDQFGNPLAVQPSLTWSADSGTITQAGFFTPSISPTSVTISAAGGSIRGTATAVVDDPPTVATTATANPSIAAGTTAALAVLGADDGGQGNLTYTWSASTLPDGAPAPKFSVNGTNAAMQCTVTFGAIGSYAFIVIITDAQGLSTTSGVTVAVDQGVTSISVSPASATITGSTTQQYTAIGYDQFGKVMATQPAFTCAASAGTITCGGLFTAPASPGVVTISATNGAVQGTAQATVTPFLGLQDPGLRALTSSLFARDGRINRADMIQILESVGSEDGVVDAAEFGDFRKIVAGAAVLNIPGYVDALAGDVVNGNAANANYQGRPLGNLAAGNSVAKLDDLVNKWFLGLDHPAATDPSYGYQTCAGSLFGANGPKYTDVDQGYLGDCYFISALGSIARVSAADIQNLFLYNGDSTWTVRFYCYNATSSSWSTDYVTVDNMLPVDSWGNLVYSDCGQNCNDPTNVLWIALAEKAYAQWNETGDEGRDGTNTYAGLGWGDPGVVDEQVLGRSTTGYGFGSEQAVIDALNNNMAVSSCTVASPDPATNLVGGHCYNVIAYNASTGTFTLFNPWNNTQPNPLSWADCANNLQGFAVANPMPTEPVITSPAPAASPSPDPSTLVPMLSDRSTATASATPVLTKISVSPAKASMECSTTEQSTAVGLDQFGHRLTNQPAFTWKASSGTIDQNGLFTSSTQTGSVTITAVSGSKRGTATVTVINLPPAVATPPSVTLYATGTTAELSVLGADGGGGHALNVVGYDNTTQTFTLYTPDGCYITSQTWAQVQSNDCPAGIAVVNPLPTPPVIGSRAPAASPSPGSLAFATALAGPRNAVSPAAGLPGPSSELTPALVDAVFHLAAPRETASRGSASRGK